MVYKHVVMTDTESINNVSLINGQQQTHESDNCFKYLISPFNANTKDTIDVELFVNKVNNTTNLSVNVPSLYRFALIPSAIN